MLFRCRISLGVNTNAFNYTLFTFHAASNSTVVGKSESQPYPDRGPIHSGAWPQLFRLVGGLSQWQQVVRDPPACLIVLTGEISLGLFWIVLIVVDEVCLKTL